MVIVWEMPRGSRNSVTAECMKNWENGGDIHQDIGHRRRKLLRVKQTALWKTDKNSKCVAWGVCGVLSRKEEMLSQFNKH